MVDTACVFVTPRLIPGPLHTSGTDEADDQGLLLAVVPRSLVKAHGSMRIESSQHFHIEQTAQAKSGKSQMGGISQ